jgi:hypothetical protein
MASTYSPNLRLELIGTGDQQGTWGATTNTNLGTLLEEAIGGYVSITVTDGADTTLTTNNGTADQSRNMIINLAGTLSAARNVICPAIEKLYVVRNATTGGYAVTFKVSGQTGVSIPNGATYVLYVNGTDAVAVTGTMANQLANAVAITGGTISGATLSNVTIAASASSLGVRDSDGSHVLSIAAGSNLTANTTLTFTTGGTTNRTLDISASNVTISTAGAALIDDADASAQRTTLGLGTISTQNSNAVTITGGSISGITDLAIADGGTGASDAATARTNLGLGSISTQNANAVAITGGTIVANASGISIRDSDASNVMTIAVGSNLTANTTLTLTTGASSNRTLDISAANVTISTAGAALIDDADASAQRTTLGLGTIATQNSNAVTITGGSVTGVTDIVVADGGTGASSFTAYAVVLGGTTSTGPLQSVSGLGTSGQVLTSAGAGAAPTWTTISSTPSGLLIRAPQILTSGTSYTTPSNCNAIYVECVGGGGGGGGTNNNSGGAAGGGGGGGAYCAKYFSVSPSTAYTYAIGSAGAGGVSGNGSSGGNTTFTVGATTVTAGGGSGGGGGSGDSESGGLGGSATNGDLNVPGQSGGFGVYVGGSSWARGGLGGNSMFGSGGSDDVARGYGGGGGARAFTSAQNSTAYAGTAGVIRIWEYT